VAAGQISVGANLIWPNATTRAFRGHVGKIEPLDPPAVAGSILGAVFPRVPAPGPAWQGYPGPVRLVVAFPKVWHPGTGEPLVEAGSTGAADSVYVVYDEEGQVHFGMDHWGGAYLSSAEIAIAPGSEHVLTIGLGALLPPEGSPLYAERPDLAARRNQVRVDLDGHTVISGVRPPYLALPDQITYGTNLAGGSTSGAAFSGRILRMEGMPWEAWPASR
jgi:hypothetical protein